MERTGSIFKTALTLLLSIWVLSVSAHDIEVNGFYYNILSASDLTVDEAENRAVDGEIYLSAAYIITAYAKSPGFKESEKTTATLSWIDGRLGVNGISSARIDKRPVLISSSNGWLTIFGGEAGERISLYSTSASMLSSFIATSATVSVDASRICGGVAIVKISENSIKVTV